ncbi:MAG TPA: serine/threonine-protein kinase [Chloroflexota bacterium]|nr:serine/threonine-protein kinase [Chloroflexota bacterium]
MRLEPGQQVDRYTISRRLGQGGMGVVYQATDAEGRPVVLKVPFDSLLDDPGTQARYEREMEIARSLDHPHIQRLLSTGRIGQDGVPYVVLEWVDGSLLREHVYEGQPLRVEEAVDLVVQLCEALQYCHERGIVHRDLKPDNVLVTRDGQVKLMDFGAALLEGGRKITTVSLSPALGTPDYMSPEQVQGQRGDARSDVYSLGALLYELLSGQPPYRGDSALAVMAQHVQSRPVPLRRRNRQVSPALEAVVAKAMRRDPDARYQSAEAFRQDLLHLERVDPAALAAEVPAEPAARRAIHGQTLVIAAIVAGVLGGGVVLLISRLA